MCTKPCRACVHVHVHYYDTVHAVVTSVQQWKGLKHFVLLVFRAKFHCFSDKDGKQNGERERENYSLESFVGSQVPQNIPQHLANRKASCFASVYMSIRTYIFVIFSLPVDTMATVNKTLSSCWIKKSSEWVYLLPTELGGNHPWQWHC